jgi:membrane-bound serine protease (ClpP class)
MDFLLNPNVAYLILIGGVLLAMLALASPGTGLLEIGAFFCIVLAGYAIYNLSFNWWALQKPRREIYLGLSILLLIVGSVFMIRPTASGETVNPLVAVFASAFVAGFLWIAVRKSAEAASAKPLHDLDGLVGKIGEARTKIEEEGSVLVGGEMWSAKSDKAIDVGSAVRVVRRDGFILIVEKSS